jgi:hypothetical protein
MIDLLVEHDPAREDDLVRALVAHEEAVLASAWRGSLGVVKEAEAAVRADPAAAFRFDAAGEATLAVGDRRWRAGRFEPTSIAELRRRAAGQAGAGQARARLWLIDGGSPATDIGSLQAHASDGTLFQVASQFNCLEATGPWVSPVERYLNDSTQGPRASISALPGVLLRHYAAPGPGGGRFVQTNDGPQIELLADVCEPGVATVHNGYLLVDHVADPARLSAALETRFEAIRVGVHERVEVVLGYDWTGAVARSPGPCIAQVFTSTLAAGGYGELTGPLVDVCRPLLRAAYLGTLLAAVGLGQRRVVLTLIGGGVFGNPLALIWEAIVGAFDKVAPLLTSDLDVVVNGRGLARQLDLRGALEDVGQRGGYLLTWPAKGGPRRTGA